MRYSFCPKCGGKLRLIDREGQLVPTCQNQRCGYIFWLNAKPAVVAIISNDQGQLLFTERAIEPHRGKLDMPGGFLHEHERPVDGVKREIMEELGVEITVKECLGHELDPYGDEDFTVLSIGLVATIAHGQPEARDEISAISWVGPASVDRSRIAFPSNLVFLDLWLVRQQQA